MLPMIPFAQDAAAGASTADSMQSVMADPGAALGSLVTLVSTYAMSALGAVVILIIGWMVAGWVNRLVNKVGERGKLDAALGRFLGQMARYAVLVMTVIACLSTVGIETTSFVAVLASAGFAVGLALQGTLGHFASGVMILIFRPFTIGDLVDAGGSSGFVRDIGLFATTLATPDNRKIIVANGAITSGTIVNYTTMGTRRADIPVGVAYGADLKKVEAVCRKAAAECELVLKEPAIGFAFTEMAASSINFSLMVWCNSDDYLAVLHLVRSNVYDALNAEGIEIPFDQIVVHKAPEEG